MPAEVIRYVVVKSSSPVFSTRDESIIFLTVGYLISRSAIVAAKPTQPRLQLLSSKRACPLRIIPSSTRCAAVSRCGNLGLFRLISLATKKSPPFASCFVLRRFTHSACSPTGQECVGENRHFRPFGINGLQPPKWRYL